MLPVKVFNATRPLRPKLNFSRRAVSWWTALFIFLVVPVLTAFSLPAAKIIGDYLNRKDLRP